jgi:hypothetical protein
MMMEEKEINEKESLEIISRMIQSTKDKIRVVSGKKLFCFGYFSAFLGVVIYALSALTSNYPWFFGWLLIYFVGLLLLLLPFNKRIEVYTYTDRLVGKVWKVIICLFLLTCGMMMVFQRIFDSSLIGLLMIPFPILFASIGLTVSGIIIRERSLQYFPMISFCIAFYMILELFVNVEPTITWHLEMSLAFIIASVIPGHILNHKAKK